MSFENIAKKIIRAACRGTWLLLDNLQLSLEIIPNLVKFLETMQDCERDQMVSIKAQVKVKVDLWRRNKLWAVDA